MRFLRSTLAVAALGLVGCGGNTVADGDAAAPSPTGASVTETGGATTTAVGSSIVPAVDVIDVSTGRPVALRATTATDRPTLIWMWAPH